MITLRHQTNIAILIAVDTSPDNLTALIATLTTLIRLLVNFGQFVSNTTLLVCDIIDAITFTAKVWSIWFNAFSFGLGVKV